MEFWGVEVKPGGKKVPCKPGEDTYLHVTQAALGESVSSKNGGQQERVVIKVEVGNKEVVLGTLTQGKCDQMALDLIFDRDFKLSHNGTQSSVYFCGYQTESARDEFYTSDEEDEEDDEAGAVPLGFPLSKGNGGLAEKPGAAAAAAAAAAKPEAGKEKPAKAQAKTPGPAVPASAGAEDEDDSDEEDYEDDDEEDDDEDEDDDDEDDDMEEDEPKQPTPKKRGPPAPPAGLTPAKKAKGAAGGAAAEKPPPKTPEVPKQKGPLAPATDGKTKGKKTPDAKDAGKQGKSPRKAGDYKCTPCSKAFTSEAGLAQHNTAKHST